MTTKLKITKAMRMRVRHNAKSNGVKLTKAQVVARVGKNIANDKKGSAAHFDWAGDGKGIKDKQFGSKANNTFRAAHGKKRANVKGAKTYGTGRRLKKGTTTPRAGGGSGNHSTGGSDAGYGGS